MIASIAMVVQSRRIITCPDIARTFRRRGLAALDQLLSWLDHDRFLQLNEECRTLVLINSRYADGLFVTMTELTDEERSDRFRMIERAIAIADDPFYMEAAPSYDWRYHIYRAYQYISSYDEFNNVAGYTPEELQRIADYGEALEDLMLSDPEYLGTIDGYIYVHSHTCRNRMHAGRITRGEFREEILALYEQRSPNRYDVDSISDNINLPREYISALDMDTITQAECDRIGSLYENALSYVFLMPKLGVFFELMDHYAPLLFDFREVPGGLSFEEMALRSFAAIHPPTYVHSLTVASLVRLLASHLLEESPEVFIGFRGAQTTEEVLALSQEILNHAEHAALCHDIGKLFVIEIIMTYGRRLTDQEFAIVKSHSAIGAYILKQHEETKDLFAVALCHHDSGDTLEERIKNGIIDPSERPFIDITCCADSLDAATDAVGRSYKKGKSFDEVVAELDAESGTRYASYVVDLLHKADLVAEVKAILSEGREENYRRAYKFLYDIASEDTPASS